MAVPMAEVITVCPLDREENTLLRGAVGVGLAPGFLGQPGDIVAVQPRG